jgi:uncharacterized protein (TIGR03437 family)
MRYLSAVCTLLFSCSAFGQGGSSGLGQGYTISTFAGGGLPANIQATAASLGAVGGVAVDNFGNIFVANGQYGRVVRVDGVSGVLTVIAGNGTHGFSGDNGTATLAQLSFPSAVAVDSSGNVYIADGSGNRVRKVSNGIISTVAGTGTQGYSGDGASATAAQLYFPTGVAVDPSGALYIADTDNNVIRKVVNGVITTIAGSGSQLGDNGPATSAQLKSPAGLTLDSSGNLFIAEQGGNRIRKISNGVITTVAGNGTAGFGGDNGGALAAQLNTPEGVAVDNSGNFYIADTLNNRIRKVTNGTITTVAGTGVSGFSGDNGTATGAQLNSPTSVALDSAGSIYLTDSGNHRIRKISGGTISTVAGGGTQLGDGSPATSAQLAQPTDITIDPNGNAYITDSGDAVIRKVTSGLISTAAGNEVPGFGGDNGSPTSAQLMLGTRSGVAADAAGNLYISDTGNNRIRKVSNGVITTVAGTGVAGFGGDGGAPTSAQLNAPAGIALDGAGNLYIADSGNNRIRKISSGVISTLAGNGTSGYNGDNVSATSAELAGPLSVASDANGNVYVGDSGNYRVRKISNGVIVSVAGTGTSGFSGDGGAAAAAQLGAFPAVAVDSGGNLYIADFGNTRIRKVANGLITTIAGNGTSGFSGDGGAATSAQFASPAGIAVDANGQIYVADQGNNRIRLLTPGPVPCSYLVSPLNTQAPAAGGSVVISITVAAGCPWSVSGLPTWMSIGGPATGSGAASITINVAPNTGPAQSATIAVAGAAVTITQPAAPPVTTLPVITAVVNGASFLPGLTPNAFITINGTNLATVSDDWSNSIVNGVLPTTLHGVSVSIGGQPAYLEYVSPIQINAIAPNIAAGPAPVTVTNSFGTSIAFGATAQTFGPAFFPWPNGHIVATRQDFSYAISNGTFTGTATVPAKPGDVIILWGTGFGPTTPSTPVGTEVPSTSTYLTANNVTVTVGGANATVYGAALAPGFAGTFQVAIQVPTTLADGEYPVVATVGGVQSPSSSTTGLLTVQH